MVVEKLIDKKTSVSIIGTVGLPANYGGFETLVQNLVLYGKLSDITVYCSSKAYPEKIPTWGNANLSYVPLNANGSSSVVYDGFSILHSCAVKKSSVILVLGVSGAIFLPLVRLLTKTKIVTNIDGLEWRRDKWNRFAQLFLKFSERLAVKFSHKIISDNEAIAQYVLKEYKCASEVIAYGGDHALNGTSEQMSALESSKPYYFCVCRIEKENNIHVILEAFQRSNNKNIVFVGNWENSKYGQELWDRYHLDKNITLLRPIYDQNRLKWLRENSIGFLHGHSAGGTNPALVESMFFRKPILPFDCDYNRSTTESQGLFWLDVGGLTNLLDNDEALKSKCGNPLWEIANKRYRWDVIAEQYSALIVDL